MSALADRRILGARGADGRVHAPPFEYDPVSSDPPGELVAVGPEGTVVSWSWMPNPLEGQPLTEPFAWALIRLDGADTTMLHAVDAGSAAAMRTGLRVRPRWSASRTGSIRDIVCFEPADAPAPADAGPGQPDAAEPATGRHDRSRRCGCTTSTPPRPGRAPTCAGWPRAGCSGSDAACAGRCTSRRGARARPTGCPPTMRWNCRRTGPSPRSA